MLMSFDAARERLLSDAAGHARRTDSVPLNSALGRVLAHDLIAPIDVPGFANAAMDGYALRTEGRGVESGQSFRVIDLALAGQTDGRAIAAHECAEIATGAALPEAADCVVPYESTVREGDIVRVRSSIVAGQNVRGARDDYTKGQKALETGRVLDAGALGVLAGFGETRVSVWRRLRIAVVVTGSELQPPGAVRGFGQIFDSNSTTLQALLDEQAESITMIGPVRDDRELLSNTLRDAAKAHDVVITAGGASAGRVDFVPELVRELGEVRFWKVAVRPGMPFLYGRIGDALVYGLPGNPVAVFASMQAMVLPALSAMNGQTPRERQWAVLARPLHKSHRRLEWRRGVLQQAADGRRTIQAHEALGSGMLRGVAESNALFRIDADVRALGRGALVEVIPFRP